MLRALLFDLDGTIVRTNEMHVTSWLQALESMGYRVGRERIEREIGKVGKLLLPEVLGADAAGADGELLDARHGEAWRELAKRNGVTIYEGVHAMLEATVRLGLRAALATSSSREDVALVEELAGVQMSEWFAAMATADDVETGKPSPDVLLGACKMLGEDPLSCAMVGDSLADAWASRNAGVAFVGVCQGYTNAREFREVGARFAAKDMGELAARIEEAVRAADASQVRFDDARLTAMMEPALRAAAAAIAAGEAPIGAALFDATGRLVASGHNSARATGDVTAHAEMVILRGLHRPPGRGATLVSTLEPCVMCLSAAMEVGIDVVVYGLDAPADGGTSRVKVPRSPENMLPRMRRGVRPDEARAMFARWLEHVATPAQRPYAEQIMAETARGG